MNEITTLAVNGQEYTLTDAGAVAFDKVQTLTDDQQLQARLNIDAASATDVENEIDRLDEAISKIATAGGGLTDAEKTLLLSLFKNTAYTADMSATIAQLETLWSSEEPDEPTTPDVTLTSISATYSGGNVPAGTAVSSLSGVKVTAHYSDGSTATVTGYTLSGTIKEGTNTITVTYNGKATTFVVVGTVEVEEGTLYQWDFTSSMVDAVNGTEALIPNSSAINTIGNKAYRDSEGVHLETDKDFAYILNGWAFNRTYELDFGEVNAEYGSGSYHGRLLTCEKADDPNHPSDIGSVVGYVGNGLLVYRNTGAWSAYHNGWKASSSLTDVAAFANKTIKITIDENGVVTIYMDGTNVYSYTVDASLFSEWPHICLGSYSTCANNTIIKGMRIYEGVR